MRRSDLPSAAVAFLATVVGGGSLLLFAAFLLLGSLNLVELGWPDRSALAWDGCLSLAFFVQHSGMVRRRFRARAAALLPERFHGALYTLASGVVLTAVVLLWQPSATVLLALEGPWRWLARGLFIVAAAGLAWAVRALGSFDAFGVAPLRAHLRGRPARPPVFVVRGPYRWVRHPLYSLMLVLIWTCPRLTADRLLFDLLWTAWIALGAALEERDLVADFGDSYRIYQRRVPMLVPWRGARG